MRNKLYVIERPQDLEGGLMRQGLVQTVRLVAVSLVAVGTAMSARAQVDTPTEDLLRDRFVINLGGFVVSSTINGSLKGSASNSDQSINFDKQFGTDGDQTRARLDFLWRITPTQHVRFSYFDDDVQRTRNIDQDLAWGDYTFIAGGQVTAETKFHVYELAYEYAFLRRQNYQIVAIAGIHVDDLTLKLSGNASLTAAEVFKLSYQGIDGNWSDLRAGATWMFSHHFGLGVGYDHFATHVDVSKGSFNGRLNFGYQGLLIYVKGGF
jgi:hypothetical protein